MSIFKIVGALLLGLGGASCAYLSCQQASYALRQAEGWLSLVRFVRTQVDCFSLPLPQILQRIDPSCLRACGYRGEEVPRSLSALLSSCEICDREVGRIAERFAGDFGKGYREEQLRSCDLYCELLSERRDALAEQLPAKKRVSSTLWISGALATVILLV